MNNIRTLQIKCLISTAANRQRCSSVTHVFFLFIYSLKWGGTRNSNIACRSLICVSVLSYRCKTVAYHQRTDNASSNSSYTLLATVKSATRKSRILHHVRFVIHILRLERDSVRDQLKLVVYTRTFTTRAPSDQLTHVVRRLPFTLLQHEPFPKMLDRLRYKTRQPAV